MHIKRGGLRSVRTLLQCTMSSIFDWEVRRLGMRDTLKHRTITVSGFGYFHQNCRFLWKKNVSKSNLGSTIHYTYMSYNTCFRLSMVSKELRLSEIGLFLQQDKYLPRVVQLIIKITNIKVLFSVSCFSFSMYNLQCKAIRDASYFPKVNNPHYHLCKFCDSGDLLLWVGVRRRGSCVKILFYRTFRPIFN